MKKKKEKYKLYKIEWEDAASSGGWIELGEEKLDPLIVTTVGFLIKETKDRLILAQSLTNGHRSADRIQIPKAWIKKKTHIKGHFVEYPK